MGLPGLKAVRTALGLTQAEIAESIGSSPVTISQLEIGNKDCSQAFQRRLAEALCCSITDLVEESGEKRLDVIKNAFELRNAQAVIARQAGKAVGQ